MHPLNLPKLSPWSFFFHGGAFFAGGIDSYDGTMRELAVKTGYIFISVGYRLAPEAKFPAGLEDCYAATSWVHANAATINADPSKIVLMGDSAGGNLATAVAFMSRDKNLPIAFQVLLYPCVAHPLAYDSYESTKTKATGYIPTRSEMQKAFDIYLPEPSSQFADNPLVMPLKATNFKGLAPALIMPAEYDLLCDEAEAYAALLNANGVSALLSRYSTIHGFATFPLKEKETAHNEINDVLKNFFAAAKPVLP